MTTNLLDRVPVERIQAEASQVHPGRLLLTLLVGVLYCVGWVAGKTFTVLAVAAGFTVAAVKVGWQDARGSAAGRSRGAP